MSDPVRNIYKGKFVAKEKLVAAEARIAELEAEKQRMRDIAQKQRSILNRYDLAPDMHQLLRTLHMEILGGGDEA